MLHWIDPSRLEQYWAHAEPFIQKALTKTGAEAEYSTEDIRGFIAEEKQQLWIYVVDGSVLSVGVTEILQFPKRRILDIPFAGAEGMTIEEWFEKSMQTLIDFAKENGCKGIKGYGRYGWIRRFKKLGTVRSEASFVLDI